MRKLLNMSKEEALDYYGEDKISEIIVRVNGPRESEIIAALFYNMSIPVLNSGNRFISTADQIAGTHTFRLGASAVGYFVYDQNLRTMKLIRNIHDVLSVNNYHLCGDRINYADYEGSQMGPMVEVYKNSISSKFILESLLNTIVAYINNSFDVTIPVVNKLMNKLLKYIDGNEDGSDIFNIYFDLFFGDDALFPNGIYTFDDSDLTEKTNDNEHEVKSNEKLEQNDSDNGQLIYREKDETIEHYVDRAKKYILDKIKDTFSKDDDPLKLIEWFRSDEGVAAFRKFASLSLFDAPLLIDSIINDVCV